MLDSSNCMSWVVLHTAMFPEVVVIRVTPLLIIIIIIIIIIISAHLHLLPRFGMIGAVPPLPYMPCGMERDRFILYL
jgi:hypothetical protein